MEISLIDSHCLPSLTELAARWEGVNPNFELDVDDIVEEIEKEMEGNDDESEEEDDDEVLDRFVSPIWNTFIPWVFFEEEEIIEENEDNEEDIEEEEEDEEEEEKEEGEVNEGIIGILLILLEDGVDEIGVFRFFFFFFIIGDLGLEVDITSGTTGGTGSIIDTHPINDPTQPPVGKRGKPRDTEVTNREGAKESQE